MQLRVDQPSVARAALVRIARMRWRDATRPGVARTCTGVVAAARDAHPCAPPGPLRRRWCAGICVPGVTRATNPVRPAARQQQRRVRAGSTHPPATCCAPARCDRGCAPRPAPPARGVHRIAPRLPARPRGCPGRPKTDAANLARTAASWRLQLRPRVPRRPAMKTPVRRPCAWARARVRNRRARRPHPSGPMRRVALLGRRADCPRVQR